MTDNLLQRAIDAIQSGDKATGQKLLGQVLKLDRNNEQAWLWLTQTDITHQQKIKSLKHVLRINPNSAVAREGLQKLQGNARPQRKPHTSQPPGPDQSPLASSPPSPGNPWLTMWFKPSTTIRYIVETDPTRHLTLLAILYGMANIIELLVKRSSLASGRLELGQGAYIILPLIFVISLGIGALGGLVALYLGGIIFRWAGSLWGGQATVIQAKAAIAWSVVPIIWLMALRAPLYLLFTVGRLFNPDPSASSSGLLFTYFFRADSLIGTVIGIWVLVLILKSISEVHGISIWKSISATTLAGVTMIIVKYLLFSLIITLLTPVIFLLERIF